MHIQCFLSLYMWYRMFWKHFVSCLTVNPLVDCEDFALVGFPIRNIAMWWCQSILYSLVSDCFFLMLQHAVTPNTVGALVAWQQEDGVHVFTVKVKTWGENWNICVLIEAEGCWGCQDEMERQRQAGWCTVDQALAVFSWSTTNSFGPLGR